MSQRPKHCWFCRCSGRTPRARLSSSPRVVDGPTLIRDPDGQEFADLSAALKEAASAARDLMAEGLRDNRPLALHRQITKAVGQLRQFPLQTLCRVTPNPSRSKYGSSSLTSGRGDHTRFQPFVRSRRHPPVRLNGTRAEAYVRIVQGGFACHPLVHRQDVRRPRRTGTRPPTCAPVPRARTLAG
jgi:hypothetical protein